jgi:hypothetical protein
VLALLSSIGVIAQQGLQWQVLDVVCPCSALSLMMVALATSQLLAVG